MKTGYLIDMKVTGSRKVGSRGGGENTARKAQALAHPLKAIE